MKKILAAQKTATSKLMRTWHMLFVFTTEWSNSNKGNIELGSPTGFHFVFRPDNLEANSNLNHKYANFLLDVHNAFRAQKMACIWNLFVCAKDANMSAIVIIKDVFSKLNGNLFKGGPGGIYLPVYFWRNFTSKVRRVLLGYAGDMLGNTVYYNISVDTHYILLITHRKLKFQQHFTHIHSLEPIHTRLSRHSKQQRIQNGPLSNDDPSGFLHLQSLFVTSSGPFHYCITKTWEPFFPPKYCQQKSPHGGSFFNQLFWLRNVAITIDCSLCQLYVADETSSSKLYVSVKY